MTGKQRHILVLLLQDHYVAAIAVKNFRVYTLDRKPITRMGDKSFSIIKKYLRRVKNNYWVIDKRVIRALHGRCWIKKQYYNLLQSKKTNHARS